MALFPASIRRALAISPHSATGTLHDVQHVVLLMQENRSFDHYFGTMSGVRGFGDRSLIPLQHGKNVFYQSDGASLITPFHLDTHSTQALRVEGTPHSWADSHLAWDEGRMSEWARWKQFQSMGHYEVDDVPFQRALAEAFTLCDAHHCSVQSGTFVNRMVFMTGTNFTPGMTEPATSQSQAAINNLNNRGAEAGLYDWTTYPERLEAAGVSWRVYNEHDWGGLVAPWQTFKQYQRIQPGDPLYDKAMRPYSLEVLASDVASGTLPQVSWVIPTPVWSEHPAESSPLQGAAYIRRVLSILSANPEVWSRTVLLISFDENDGFFDHVPPPAPPSIDDDGQVCGGSTLDDSQMSGLYYRNEVNGKLGTRPYGLGARVPLYVVSPWSRGGWVCSQVFDHTSTIRFLEARFGVEEPNITAWHRSVCGDLTSCFDFSRPSFVSLPTFPDVSGASGDLLVITDLPPVTLPAVNQRPQQDRGLRRSRALPYYLAVDVAANTEAQSLALSFRNEGEAGAVFHVYDRLHLDRLPRRYTVETRKRLDATWEVSLDGGSYDLEVFGPNGYRWLMAGRVAAAHEALANPEVVLRHHGSEHAVELIASNRGRRTCVIATAPNMYRSDRATTIELTPSSERIAISWPVSSSGLWYDFNVVAPDLPGWLRRFAGRVETGRHGISDPALGGTVPPC